MQRSEIFTKAVLVKIDDLTESSLIHLKNNRLKDFQRNMNVIHGLVKAVVLVYSVGMISTAQHRKIHLAAQEFRSQINDLFEVLKAKSYSE